MGNILYEIPSNANKDKAIELIKNSDKLPNLLKDKYIDIISNKGVTKSVRKEYKSDVDKILNKGNIIYRVKDTDKYIVTNPKNLRSELEKVNEKLKMESLTEEEIAELRKSRSDLMQRTNEAIDGALSDGASTVKDFLSGNPDNMLGAILSVFTGAIGLLSKSSGLLINRLYKLKDKKLEKSKLETEINNLRDNLEVGDDTEMTENEVNEISTSINKSIENESRTNLAEFDGKNIKSVKDAYTVTSNQAKLIFGDKYDPKKFDGMFYGLLDKCDGDISKLLGMINNSLRGSRKSNSKITNWDEARSYAFDLLKEIHKDKFDEKIAQSMIDGLMEKYPNNPAVVIGAIRGKNSNSSDFKVGGNKAMDAHGNEVVLIGIKDFPSDFPLVGIVYDIDGGFYYPDSYNYSGQDWHAAEPRNSSEYYTMNELWKWDKSIIDKLPKISKGEYDKLIYASNWKLSKYFNTRVTNSHKCGCNEGWELEVRKCPITGEIYLMVSKTENKAYSKGKLLTKVVVFDGKSATSWIDELIDEYNISKDNIEFINCDMNTNKKNISGADSIYGVTVLNSKSNDNWKVEVQELTDKSLVINVYQDSSKVFKSRMSNPIEGIEVDSYEEAMKWVEYFQDKYHIYKDDVEIFNTRLGKNDINGKCPDSGCIEQDEEGNWRIISNKTGEYWKPKYKSEESAKAALRAYHASNSQSVNNRDRNRIRKGWDESIEVDLMECPKTGIKYISVGENNKDGVKERYKCKKCMMKSLINKLMTENNISKENIEYNLDRIKSSRLSNLFSKIKSIVKEVNPKLTCVFDSDDGVIEISGNGDNLVIESGNEKLILSGINGLRYTTKDTNKFLDVLRRELI